MHIPAGLCEGWRYCGERRSSNGDDSNEDGGKQETLPLVKNKQTKKPCLSVYRTILCLQHTIRAPKAGVIKKVLFKEGSQANRHAVLVQMDEEEEEVAQAS